MVSLFTVHFITVMSTIYCEEPQHLSTKGNLKYFIRQTQNNVQRQRWRDYITLIETDPSSIFW